MPPTRVAKRVKLLPPDLLFGDCPDLDCRKAAEIAKYREMWKKLMPSKRC